MAEILLRTGLYSKEAYSAIFLTMAFEAAREKFWYRHWQNRQLKRFDISDYVDVNCTCGPFFSNSHDSYLFWTKISEITRSEADGEIIMILAQRCELKLFCPAMWTVLNFIGKKPKTIATHSTAWFFPYSYNLYVSEYLGDCFFRSGKRRKLHNIDPSIMKKIALKWQGKAEFNEIPWNPIKAASWVDMKHNVVNIGKEYKYDFQQVPKGAFFEKGLPLVLECDKRQKELEEEWERML